MKKLAINIFLVSLTMLLKAQTANLAETAPKGILVFLGTKIPNGIKMQNIKVLRKSGNTDFVSITEVKAPATEQEFLAKVSENKKYFPDTEIPTDEKLKVIWAKAVRTALLDSVGYIGRIPAVRIALGLCYYDFDVKEKTKYQYQIKMNGNATSDSYTSNTATYPLHPKFDDIVLSDYDYSKKGLYIRWRSTGKNPPAGFKVFQFQNKTPVEIIGIKGQYKKRDTTFYSITIKDAPEGKTFAYSVVAIDKYGNTAIGNTPYQINNSNPNSLYFKTTQAKRDNKLLGIKLVWKLSSTDNVQSVHIFKSEEALKKFKEVGTAKGSDSTFIDANIIPDKMYYYYLLARDRTGKEMVKSSTFFEAGVDLRKPITPQILTGVGIKNGVKLLCAVPDKFVNGIRVYRAEGTTAKFEVIKDLYATKDSDNVTFIDSSKTLSGKRTYSYYIVSVNTSNISSNQSNVVQVQPAISTEPLVPAFLKTYFQDGVINLAWQDIKLRDVMVKGYLVSKTEKGKDKWTNIFGADSVFPGSHFEDRNFEEGRSYEYKVQTVDEFCGKSKNAAINEVSIASSKVIPPSGLKAISIPDGVELEWAFGDTSISQYKIYRYQRCQKAESIGTTKFSVRNYLDKTAKKGQLYFYYLTSLDNKKRESEPGEEVGVRH